MSSPRFLCGVRVTRSLALCPLFVDCCLFFYLFSFGHCVVCPSIYGFWLPLWYLQTLLTVTSDNLACNFVKRYTKNFHKMKRKVTSSLWNRWISNTYFCMLLSIINLLNGIFAPGFIMFLKLVFFKCISVCQSNCHLMLVCNGVTNYDMSKQ
jgi:hypothetical protein